MIPLHTISGAPPATLWRVFLAGADSFDSYKLAAVAYPEGLPFAETARHLVAAVTDSVLSYRPSSTEIVPAGFEIEVRPEHIRITYAPWRSAISFVLLDDGHCEVVIGASIEDSPRARDSARRRHERAMRALGGAS